MFLKVTQFSQDDPVCLVLLLVVLVVAVFSVPVRSPVFPLSVGGGHGQRRRGRCDRRHSAVFGSGDLALLEVETVFFLEEIYSFFFGDLSLLLP